MSAVDLIPAGHTLLPCDCVVKSVTGQLARCSRGHDNDAPQHRRSAPKPRGR